MQRLLFILLCCLTFTVHASQPLNLQWQDLIPQSEKDLYQKIGLAQLNGEEIDFDESQFGQTRAELNDTLIRIPGFVIPLQSDAETVTELLLVPFYGACLHVPAPEPNQIIYVKFAEGAPLPEMWEVVYVQGLLKTQSNSHELAQTGYLMQATKIEKYLQE